MSRRKSAPKIDLDLLGRQRALAWMIAGFVHQFRTPLQVIQTHLEAAREVPARPAALEPSFDMIQRSVARLQASVSQLLNFAGGRQGEKSVASVDRAVSLLADFLTEESRRRGIVLEIKLQSARPVRYDAYALQEAILNLCMNAFQAMADGGRLLIETRDAGAKHVEVRVSDTGHGMTPATLKKLGSAFYTQKQGGVGLGVYFTRRVIADHQGTLAFESRLGKGTIAILTLPASTKSTHPPPL